MRRVLAAALLAVPAGLVLGAGGQALDHLHPGLRWVGALGVPWLVVAFGAGAVARERWAAPAAGATTLVVATAAWYGLHATASGSLRAAPVALAWVPACILGGGAFALAGAAWRSGGRVGGPAGAALLGGALAGEALLLAGEWAGRGARLVLAVELAAGALAAVLLGRRSVTATLVAASVVAVLAGAAEAEVRETLRHAGWRGL